MLFWNSFVYDPIYSCSSLDFMGYSNSTIPNGQNYEKQTNPLIVFELDSK